MEKPRGKMLYLSRQDVESLDISIPEIITRLEMVFTEKGNQRVEMPPKPAIHTNGDAFLHAMPAFIPKLDSAGMKWVGGYPENHKQGLPYITGLLILNDTQTGVPYALMDCAWITAIRTAAATALTARYLARPDSSVLAILGCGVQGRYNLEALNTLFRFSRVRGYDISSETAQRYAREMGKRLNTDIEVCKTPRDAVQGADIVVTAGPFLRKPKPVLEFRWIKRGALVCPLDLDSYLKPQVFIESDFLCTDDLTQFNQFRKSGLFKDCPADIADFSDVVAGRVEGRKKPGEIITAVNIGLALEDMGVAPIVYERARERDIGVWLDL
jgi:ornithine cyclodeaminase/alanine dehydrogenase